MTWAGRELGRAFTFALILLSSVVFLSHPSIGQLKPNLRPLALDGQISDDGTKIGISWDTTIVPSGAQVTVHRRELGAGGVASWQIIQPKLLTQNRVLDVGLIPGRAYEYQVSVDGTGRALRGYWTAGQKVPAIEQRGMALVIVDETLSGPLASYLDRFMLDLIGDGWRVNSRTAARGTGKDAIDNLERARALRSWIANTYWRDPFSDHVVILIGHVPVVRAGRVRPDGHDRQPVPTDLFYADPDGVWPDNGKGVLLPSRVPSEHIKLQIGRIDFSRLGPEFESEEVLLKDYFDKNHHWRHGLIGDLRSAYGKNKNLRVERHALGNIVGPEAVVARGHHDVNTQGPFLLGVDFGDWDGRRYPAHSPAEAVFTINFGSGKHMFDGRANPMRALLAQSWYPLAAGWGGRPAWRLHGLAMGESIGQAHLRTVNNGFASKGGLPSQEYVPTGRYPWINPIWVNLLGDPTLRPFPAKSVSGFDAYATPEGTKLSWSVPPGAMGVRLYRAQGKEGPFVPLADRRVLKEGSFIDVNPDPNVWYMARTYDLTDVYAGSVYRLSQGVFATVENDPPEPQKARLVLGDGDKIALSFDGTDSNFEQTLLGSPMPSSSVVAVKSLRREGVGFSFSSNGLESDTYPIPFTLFDGVTTVRGVLDVEVLAQ